MKGKWIEYISIDKFIKSMEMRNKEMLREVCPCDISGDCPYGATSYSHCEYHCGEPDFEPFEDIDEYDEDYDIPDEWLNPEE